MSRAFYNDKATYEGSNDYANPRDASKLEEHKSIGVLS